ncbi:hypothetical protein MMC30_005364 [Trapelia coarctata]|nr:hypothetical protein [Trapelia coarctata]
MAELVGGMTGALQGTVTGVLNKGQNWIDKFFPPERRAELWAMFVKFTTEKPMLASFLLSQFALSGIPLALFFVMSITVFVFALVAALLIGVLGALLFTAFCVGVALLVLLPTLFITTFGATFVWLWGVGAYYLIKWFNQKEIPGIHTGFVDGVKDKLYAPSSEANGSAGQDGDHKESPRQPKKLENGSAHKGEKKSENKGEHKSGGGAPKLDKVGDVGSATDKVGDVTDKAGDVTDKADVADLKKKADVGDLSKKADVGNVTKSVPGLS